MRLVLTTAGIITIVIGITTLFIQDAVDNMVTGLFFSQLEKIVPESGKEPLSNIKNSFDFVGPLLIIVGIIELVISNIS